MTQCWLLGSSSCCSVTGPKKSPGFHSSKIMPKPELPPLIIFPLCLYVLTFMGHLSELQGLLVVWEQLSEACSLVGCSLVPNRKSESSLLSALNIFILCHNFSLSSAGFTVILWGPVKPGNGGPNTTKYSKRHRKWLREARM